MTVNGDLFLKILDPLGLDRKGKLNFLFGVTLLPMLMMVGSAMDYVGAVTANMRLQGAAETASLELAQRLREGQDRSQFQPIVDSIFKGVEHGAVGGTSFSSLKEIYVNERQVCVRATASTHPAFMKIAGIHELRLKADSCRDRSEASMNGGAPQRMRSASMLPPIIEAPASAGGLLGMAMRASINPDAQVQTR